MKRIKKKKPLFMVFVLGLFFIISISSVIIIVISGEYQILKFEKLSAPILNPLMGWAPWATIKKIKQPHTLVYMDLSWREFEPQEGMFDFVAFEEKQQFVRWRREGKRVVFRFVTDFPGDTDHMDIPDWLFEKINGDGEFYDNEYGKGFSPNYSNPLFIKYHGLALQALGDRYAQDGFFAFIELGSLGHWGEWHLKDELQRLPPEGVRNLYVTDYLNAFPSIHLLMRRPFTIARDMQLGLYNDMTGSLEDTNIWLGWIKKGGDYLPTERNTLVPMPEGWKKAPVGGEQAPTMTDDQIYGTDLETTLNLLRESHVTFIGPGGPYKVDVDSLLQDGIDQVLSTLGYRLYIENVEMPLYVRFGKSILIKFRFSNDGIAPFYYEWPTRVYLFDESCKLLNIFPMSIDVRKIFPGQVYEADFILPVTNLADGKYTIGFAIVDPLTDRPGVKIANENPRDDLIQEVGSFEIMRLINFLAK